MQLTPQQKSFFDTFGYLALPGALKDDVGWIIEEFEAVWRARQDIQHDGSQRTMFPASFADQSEKLCTLLDHPVVSGLAEGLLGEDFNYYGGDGNFYSGDTGWHSDIFGGLKGWPQTKIRFIKIAYYLDPLGRDTGALRVIPGSHRVGDAFHKDLWEGRDFGLDGRDIPCVALETQPGDLVVFDHNLRHASYGGSKRRRMFTMNLFQKVENPEQRELVEQLMGMYAEQGSTKFHSPVMLETASPERMRHLTGAMTFEPYMSTRAVKK